MENKEEKKLLTVKRLVCIFEYRRNQSERVVA